jgi:hypothetical protein
VGERRLPRENVGSVIADGWLIPMRGFSVDLANVFSVVGIGTFPPNKSGIFKFDELGAASMIDEEKPEAAFNVLVGVDAMSAKIGRPKLVSSKEEPLEEVIDG